MSRDGIRLPALLPPVLAWREPLRLLPIDVQRGEVVVAGERRRLLPQQQAVLAVLLQHEVGSHDKLISSVWGNWLEPPASMSSALRLIVTGVRRALAGSGAEVITLVGKGYRLVLAANDNLERLERRNG